jgi:hypothetical protein
VSIENFQLAQRARHQAEGCDMLGLPYVAQLLRECALALEVADGYYGGYGGGGGGGTVDGLQLGGAGGQVSGAPGEAGKSYDSTGESHD